MKFEKLPKLNGAVIERLRVVLRDDSDLLAEQIKNGVAELWAIDNGVSYMITRVEKRDLVVCCFDGKDLKNVVPHLLAAAKRMQLSYVRFHTRRPALSRLLNNYNMELYEYIYRGKVNEN